MHPGCVLGRKMERVKTTACSTGLYKRKELRTGRASDDELNMEDGTWRARRYQRDMTGATWLAEHDRCNMTGATWLVYRDACNVTDAISPAQHGPSGSSNQQSSAEMGTV